MNNFSIKSISREECKQFLLNIHYAKRMPCISYSFGCYEEDKLIGIVTYGQTANNNLNKWGDFKLLELNRLCFIKQVKNLASWFVSRTFALLPHPTILISYADSSWNHHGYIYQALNFIYLGSSKGDTEFIINGRQFHRKRMYEMFGTGSVKQLKELCPHAISVKQGDKHRYIILLGNKTEKKAMLKEVNLRYKIEPYPKGDNKNYSINLDLLSAKEQLKLL